MEDTFFTMGQAAKELGISKSTLFRWEKGGQIPLPKRRARGNKERIYTRVDIESIRAWKDRIEEPTQVSGAAQ